MYGSMREAREALGMSQSELARRMVAAGLSTWTQTIVSRRENNEDNLRWSEAIALRGIIAYPAQPGDSNANELVAKGAAKYRSLLHLFHELEEVF